ncbi:ATP-binding protein [Fulvivirga sp. M361]|uniref:ATP-binding protein n=1 Tax=Fulvivirga sp. M361 TaxID=2594266 RepID=UPI00117AECCA|nr:ATP-binding protein [Fulvivirga sp. M361]TRX56247.1 ATP-binding protein [Fulvivirga sp. M361]
MIKRQLYNTLKERLNGDKAIILIGPRQTGKTTLIKALLKEEKEHLFLNGDDPVVRDELAAANTEKLKQIIGNHSIIFIDEAQRVKNIGLTLKMITDQFSSVRLLVSGSSALEINQEITEPLTGRKWEYQLYPVSWSELLTHLGYIVTQQQLEIRLVYGMYPEVITAHARGEGKEVLQQLTSSYLYQDVLSVAGIRKPEIIEKLLQALAYQVGSEVSYNELANTLGIDKNTVSHYLNILEKTFVIFRLQPYSRNLRNEISSTRKIYFYDNGIRNSLISNYAPLEFRQDKGALWENFIIAERIKQNHYQKRFTNTYFWRTRQQQEVDYLEEKDGDLYAFEFKLSNQKKAKFPLTFTRAYPDAKQQSITPENFLEFVM